MFFNKLNIVIIGDTMKRFLLILWILILSTSCTKAKTTQNNINTIIEEEKNILIGINYPVTGFNKLDTLIKDQVETIYNDFKENYESFNSLTEKSELNIDYIYSLVSDKYINICISIFIDSSSLPHPLNYIETFVYNTETNQLLTLENIIEKESMKTLVSMATSKLLQKYSQCIFLDQVKGQITENYNDYLLFTFDDENLTIYFNPATIASSYCDVLDIQIPLDKLKLKLNIQKEEKSVIKEEIELPKNVIDPNKKVVALTFDDGPSAYTKDIIELLHEENIVGTFFILGNKVEIYKDTINTSLSYGNEIGNHSYNHKWLTKLEIEDMLLQIDKTQEIIYENTGYTPSIFRPTYGSINEKIRKNINLDIILWNVDTMDWKYKSVDKIVNRATKNVKDGDIILMHDTYERTYKALKKIIPILKKQGFEFVTISELKEINLIREHKK